MPTLRLELPVRPSHVEVEALQADLEPYGDVYEMPPVSYDVQGIALAVSLLFEAVQGIDVLIKWLTAWLQCTPRAHEATIRLADGRSFTVKTTDEEALRKALKAALKEL